VPYSLASAFLLFLLLIDPFGNVPLFVAMLKDVPVPRRRWIVLREHAMGMVALTVFLFAGQPLLDLLHVSREALGVAGGIILFLIALRMVFPSPHGVFGDVPGGEPFLVPLAIPSIAGPSAIAAILVVTPGQDAPRSMWLGALLAAGACSALILLFATEIARRLGPRGVQAMERIMGLLLTTVAVEMLLRGVKSAWSGES